MAMAMNGSEVTYRSERIGANALTTFHAKYRPISEPFQASARLARSVFGGAILSLRRIVVGVAHSRRSSSRSHGRCNTRKERCLPTVKCSPRTVCRPAGKRRCSTSRVASTPRRLAVAAGRLIARYWNVVCSRQLSGESAACRSSHDGRPYDENEMGFVQRLQMVANRAESLGRGSPPAFASTKTCSRFASSCREAAVAIGSWKVSLPAAKGSDGHPPKAATDPLD